MPTIGKPKIDRRSKIMYMGIRNLAPFKGMSKVIGKIADELDQWMEANKVKPSGPPFCATM